MSTTRHGYAGNRGRGSDMGQRCGTKEHPIAGERDIAIYRAGAALLGSTGSFRLD